jgi:plastocyanin
MPQPSFIRTSGSKFGLMKRTLPFLASLGLLAACGGGTTAPTETLPAGATVVTAVSGLRFDAAEYGPVKAGEVLLGYSNEDSIRHTLIIAKDDVKVPNFKLVIAKKGSVDSGAVTLDAGTYTILCDVPGHGNMKATLTVE